MSPNSSATLKRALAAIDQLQRELAEARQASGRTHAVQPTQNAQPTQSAQPGPAEPVAVVGLGCRFPGGAVDADSYWNLLAQGVDAVGEIPPDRWDTDAFYQPEAGVPGKTATRWGAFLEDIDRFDAAFFGISEPEAAAMDPAQRLVLEVAWEALENAGATRVQGSRTGVFVGVIGTDYAVRQFSRPADMTPYAVTGNAHSVLSGRLAYLLDLRGPALSVDTACSSSLTAVHLACQSLRTGEVDTALAGGVNVILSPLSTIGLSQFGMMSPDGRCHSFDAAANGFVRGEGCGIVVLKRLSDAVAAGDEVLAVLRGSAVNQDGRSTSLTAPNVLSQRELLGSALRAAGVRAEQVSYIEAHGTGTPLGDPIEAEALAEVYPAASGPWHLGSVKTNLGHQEAAAGIAGLIKVVLALQHRQIPPSLHFSRLNPHISLDPVPFEVPTRLTAWEPRQGRRIAGVSSFGLSGTNVHLLVEQAPERPVPPEDTRRPLSVLALSGRTETSLRETARRHRARLNGTGERVSDYCYSAGTGRVHHAHRLAVVGATAAELAAGLDRALKAPASSTPTETSGVVFLFGGGSDGGPDVSTVRQLRESSPLFRAELERCADLLHEQGIALLPELIPTGLTDPAGPATTVFAVEYALTQLWRSWHVEPAAVLGHAAGEVTAAWAAGSLTLADALRVVSELDWIDPSSLYSSQADPQAVAAFGRAVDGLQQMPPRIPMVSGTDGALLPWHQAPPAGYWQRQISRPMQLAEAVSTLRGLGRTRFLEIGPDATVTGLLGSMPVGEGLLLAGSLQRGQDGWRSLLTALGALYQDGLDVDWAGFDRDYRRVRVAVPTTPFERERYWYDSPRSDLGDVAPGPDVASDEALQAGIPNQTDGGPTREVLLAAPSPQRFGLLAEHIARGVGAALGSGSRPRIGSPAEVGLDQPFLELGLDSLMAIGLRNQIRAQLGVDLPIATLLQEGTVRRVTEQTLDLLNSQQDAPDRPDGQNGQVDEELLAELAQLPEDEVRRLLQEEH